MGFLSKLFGSEIQCPACGGRARDSFSGPKCLMPDCVNYEGYESRSGAPAERATPPPGMWAKRNMQTGETTFVPDSVQPSNASPLPFKNPIQIRYTNFRGEDKTFVAERNSIRRQGAHLTAAVEPTGRRIALKMDRIINPLAIEDHLARLPNPNEARVLNFHKRRGSTSPLYESLRAKYPDY